MELKNEIKVSSQVLDTIIFQNPNKKIDLPDPLKTEAVLTETKNQANTDGDKLLQIKVPFKRQMSRRKSIQLRYISFSIRYIKN